MRSIRRVISCSIRRAIRRMTPVVLLLVASNILAADPPNSKPAGGLVDSAADPPAIVWNSARSMAPDAIIWKTDFSDFDSVNSFAVSGKMVLIGGHHALPGGPWNKGQGRLYCLSIDTGKVAWSVTHEAIPQRIHDMAATISSTPFVDGDRVYYVSNRGELCCVRLADGHTVWTLDMPEKLGVFKRDPGDAADLAPSPIVVGDIVYCVTANGSADGCRVVPAPDAPSFLAVDKLSGKVIWSSSAPGKNIKYGQWSTPAPATIDGTRQILFPGGDSALYAFEPLTGRQLWKVDCRDPKATGFWGADFITAPPLVVGETAYVSPAINFEISGGPRRLLAIDLRMHSIRWAVSPKRYDGTLGPMATDNAVVYSAGSRGLVVALDAANGNARWTHDLQSDVLGGICLHDGKLYVVTEDGDLFILSAATGQTLDQCEIAGGMVGTPIVRDKTVYVAGHYGAWAIRLPGE